MAAKVVGFSFKHHRPRNFESARYEICMGRDVVGYILPEKRFSSAPAVVSFRVSKEPSTEDPADFRVLRLKKRFDSIEDAKTYLEGDGVFEALSERYDVYRESKSKRLEKQEGTNKKRKRGTADDSTDSEKTPNPSLNL